MHTTSTTQILVNWVDVRARMLITTRRQKKPSSLVSRSMHTLVVRKYMMYLPTLKNSTVVTLHTAPRFDEGSSRHDDRGYVMTSWRDRSLLPRATNYEYIMYVHTRMHTLLASRVASSKVAIFLWRNILASY